eukprot:59990-Prymnesium_polylepis.1
MISGGLTLACDQLTACAGRVTWRDQGAEGCRGVVTTHPRERELSFLWPRILSDDPTRPSTSVIPMEHHGGAGGDAHQSPRTHLRRTSTGRLAPVVRSCQKEAIGGHPRQPRPYPW